MPITVKHSGNAAPSIWGAFAGGKGRRQAEESSAALARIERAKDRRLQVNLHRSSQHQRIQELRDQRAFQREMEELSHRQSFERMDYNRTLQSEMADEAAQRWRDKVEFEFDAQQRAEFDRLSKGYEEAKASGEFTEDELDDIRRQVIAKQAGIEPMPRLKRTGPSPQEMFDQNTFERNGVVYGFDKDGAVKKLADSNSAPTFRDISDLYKQAIQVLQNEDGTLPGREEIDRFVQDALELRDRFTPKNPSDVEISTELIGAPDSGNVGWGVNERSASGQDGNGLPTKTVERGGKKITVPVPTGEPSEQKAPAKEENKVYTEKEFISAFREAKGRKPNWREIAVAKRRGIIQ